MSVQLLLLQMSPLLLWGPRKVEGHNRRGDHCHIRNINGRRICCTSRRIRPRYRPRNRRRAVATAST